MFSITTLKKQVSAKIPLTQNLPDKGLNAEQQRLLKWTVSLLTQTQMQRTLQLEKMLNELATTEIDDGLRLQLMAIVMSAVERLMATLHEQYGYDKELDDEQLKLLIQTEALYYLSASVYEQIIKRQRSRLKQQKRGSIYQSWQQIIHQVKWSPILLAKAIYLALATYQKLLYQRASFYQKPPAHVWSTLNQLYYLADKHAIAHIDLSNQVVTRQAPSIHQLYSQLCLHSLLNVYALSRPNIRLLQRLLPVWASRMRLSAETEVTTRVFVDLQSANPPDYLNAASTINPYNEQCASLFFDLKPLTHYLEQLLVEDKSERSESPLVAQMLHAIKYRYIDHHQNHPKKLSPKLPAIVLSGFDAIHYQVAGARRLSDLIAAHNLPAEQQPLTYYDKRSKLKVPTLEVASFDSTDAVSRFRALQLLTSADGEQPSITSPLLPLTSLFLLSRPNIHTKLKHSLGVVRWVTIFDKENQQNIDIEWEVLGHDLSACALRLDNNESAYLNFVPAFVIAKDEDLNIEYSLLLPADRAQRFHTNDKVVLRLGEEQKHLRLQRCLMSTDKFIQYEFIRI